MAKGRKRRRPDQQPAANQPLEQASSVPKFEIGVKGDEFDLKYTRAAAKDAAKADSLLRGLSKDTRTSGYNLLNFSALAILILFISLSFVLLSRSGKAPSLSNTTLTGYTQNLSEYYKDTLPFGRAIRTLGAYLGFCEMPEPGPEPDIEPEEPVPPPAAVTTAAPEPEPEVTTAPTVTDTPTSAPATEETTEFTVPETHTMYANATVNIRLSPDSDSMQLGYFSINQPIEVIELLDSGWASIWYNDIVAYISSDYLSSETIATTKRRTTTAEPETEPETTTEEITTVPEETTEETTAVPAETTPPPTTTTKYLDPETSYYLEHYFTTTQRETEPQPTETEPEGSESEPEQSSEGE